MWFRYIIHFSLIGISGPLQETLVHVDVKLNSDGMDYDQGYPTWQGYEENLII